MIIEPVLGEGGYVPAPPRFLQGFVEICREHGILFIADEVQTGFGRTGKMFAVEHYGVEPDVAGDGQGHRVGLPDLGDRCVGRADGPWPTGSHGGTYGGNPIGCAAALATIDVLTEPGFLDDVERGASSCDGLAGAAARGRRDRRGPRARADGRLEFADPARVAAVPAPLPRRGPADPHERRHLRHRAALDAAARGDEAEIDLALAAFAKALAATR